jgi:hypothetical protein
MALLPPSELALLWEVKARHLGLISAECYYLMAGITAISLILGPAVKIMVEAGASYQAKEQSKNRISKWSRSIELSEFFP